MHYTQMLLSKAIDDNNVQALTKYGITARDCATEGDRQTLRFILDYAEKNRGQAPGYAVVTAECPDFVYTPLVGDSYEFLAKEIKKHSAKVQFAELVNGVRDDKGKLIKSGLGDKFETVGQKDIFSLFDWLQSEVESIKINTNTSSKVGTDIKADGDKFLAEYDRRKSGESFKTWSSKFSSIGDYVSGNMYVVYGKSGRGKSVITLEEVIEMAMNGANVLIWAMEMPWFEVLVRIYVSVSARKGLTTLNVDGIDMTGGFDAGDIRKGKLSDEFDTAFRFFIDTINDEIPGNITVRGVDDADFGDRTIRALEADIAHTKADVVMVDPFYYLHYEKNTSKTTGGDAAATSEKLRHLAGRSQTVMFAITQADETAETESDDGSREIELPKRKDVSKTKQLMQDASMLIAVDTDYKQGRGLVGVNKGRDGGEGDFTEIIYIPQVGIVRQPETGEAAVSQFNF